jgi:hypothetical protein
MIERRPYPGPEELPAELAEALSGAEHACLTVASERGTLFVIKAPTADIAAVRGAIPVELRHQLYRHPAAPVICMLLRLYDDPAAPLALETFINVADPAQRADYARLASQLTLELRFYDEILQPRLAKQITHSSAPQVPAILSVAEELRRHIPLDLYNFEEAKHQIQEVTDL